MLLYANIVFNGHYKKQTSLIISADDFIHPLKLNSLGQTQRNFSKSRLIDLIEVS